MRIGPASRGGFTPLANAEAERLFNELTPEQFRLYVGLRIEAQFSEPCERRDAFGRPVLVEPGEVLFGIESAATRYGMNRDQVRRAVERFERLRLLTRRPGVAAAIPRGPMAATPCGREAATPPTVLTFLTDRETCWRTPVPAPTCEPPPATPRGPVAATIQHTTHEPTNPRSERAPAPDAVSEECRQPARADEVRLEGEAGEAKAELEARLRSGYGRGYERTLRIATPSLAAETVDKWTNHVQRLGREAVVSACVDAAGDYWRRTSGGEVESLRWFLSTLERLRPGPSGARCVPCGGVEPVLEGAVGMHNQAVRSTDARPNRP